MGTYTKKNTREQCDECPPGFIGDRIGMAVCLECSNADACAGGSACAEGYDGTLCGVCADNYYKTLIKSENEDPIIKCLKCKNLGITVALSVVPFQSFISFTISGDGFLTAIIKLLRR